MLLFTIGLISSVVPNIPLVIAMVPLLKEYIVNAGFVGAEILAPNSTTPIPTAVLPLFYAMIYGATLGGNGTLVGASANIVAAGIAEQYGKARSLQRSSMIQKCYDRCYSLEPKRDEPYHNDYMDCDSDDSFCLLTRAFHGFLY